VTVLVYPDEFEIPGSPAWEDDADPEEPETLVGESWQEGAVVLAWEHVRPEGIENREGLNVVLHEFAHQLEQEGHPDGSPLFQSREAVKTWARVLEREYRTLRGRVAAGRPTFLDDYGATDETEFFAVATEYFFEKSRELRARHPALYEEMRKFYDQDPASYGSPRRGPARSL
jgi:Mlc titration factor MtfA (ptsG expression regulator)